MKQTAIIVDIGGGREVLVRVTGIHVPPDFVQADVRDSYAGTWQRRAFKVRNEGEG
jgi:hypothetical protein